MSGLDKIKSQILEDAKAQAAESIAKAREQAAEIIRTAEEESAAECIRIAQKSEKETADYAARVESACDMQRRKALLTAKQQLIREVLTKAYEQVLALPAEEYFALLLRLLERNVQPEQGEMYLSEADLRRMPQGFETQVKETAKKAGGSLEISSQAKAIDGGFVLT